jgi:hypothetical protein
MLAIRKTGRDAPTENWANRDLPCAIIPRKDNAGRRYMPDHAEKPVAPPIPNA